jgi:peptidoglycan hydrolase-like protein with peptidoglycan-binding domain
VERFDFNLINRLKFFYLGGLLIMSICTAKQYIDKFVSYVGYREKNHASADMESFTADAGSGNYQKFQPLCNAGNGDQWCQYTVNGVCVEVCGNIKDAQYVMCDTTGNKYMTGYTPEGASFFKKAGRWYTTPQFGDVVYYYTSSMGRICHTGAVVSVNTSKKTFRAVEGNTNSDGFATNGGCVAIHEYSYANVGIPNRVVGFGRPRFAPEGYTLKKGDSGDKVRKLQTELNLTGFCDCAYYGNNNFVDGSFGNTTEKYVKLLQSSARIDIDGEYGKDSQNALEKYVKAATDSKLVCTVDTFLSTAKVIAQQNKENNFDYGNAACLPAVNSDDKLVSCDRFVDQVLWTCGLKDVGNRGVNQLGEYLASKGAKKINDKNDVTAGDIIFFTGHVFILGNKVSDGVYERYDAGSKDRIRLTGAYSGYTSQPFKEGLDGFVYAYRLPFKTTEKEPTQDNTSNNTEAYSFTPLDVSNGSTGTSVLLLQEILKARGYKGVNGKELDLDREAGANTIYAINSYQNDRRKQGVELGTNGKNDGTCGQKMWKDLIAL